MRPSRATSTGDRPHQPGPVRYRFVGGKGGAGKTTCAASLAIRAAERGLRTLVLSTDPAPSLADAFAQPLGGRPRAVRGVPRLHAAEVDTHAAFAAWLAPRRATFEQIAVRGTWLAEDEVAKLVRLSLPGIDEIAGLLQIAELGEQRRYDHVIVDSAPTGHLLRLLSMPGVLQRIVQVLEEMQAKHRAVVSALRGAWTPDAADALVREMDRQAGWLSALLRDSRRTAIAWVTLPEAMSLEETTDAVTWLREEGVPVDTLIVNRLTPPPNQACSWCDARRQVEAGVLATMRQSVARRFRSTLYLPAASREPRGIASLTRLGRALENTRPASAVGSARPPRVVAAVPNPGNDPVAPVITPETRLVFFGGKGGVGKTTCAVAAALDAARRMPARRVLLLSVDPAHSVGDVLGQQVSDAATAVRGGPSNVVVRELDATRAFEKIRARFAKGVDALFRHTAEGEGIGGAGDARVMRHLLELAPPGVDELAAIVEVLERLLPEDEARRTANSYDLLVMDTAPTGHALRLIEMPALLHDWVKAVMGIVLAYRRALRLEHVAPALLRLSRGLGRLRGLMADPMRARFIVVTRPAALPRAETVRLLDRLAPARIRAPVLIVNALGAGACVGCRRERAAQERELSALHRKLGRGSGAGARVLLAPAAMPPPHGARALEGWLRRWRELDRSPLSETKRRRRVR